jgi:hypothetical protein
MSFKSTIYKEGALLQARGAEKRREKQVHLAEKDTMLVSKIFSLF